jgi:Skp family chaperone for outer membrane proteins
MSMKPFVLMSIAATMMLSVASVQAQKSTVAVVDVQRAFNAVKEKSQIDAELTTMADKVKQEDASRTKTIKELQQDLSILSPGTAAHTQKQNDLEKAVLSRQVWLNYQQLKLNRERALRVENMYKKMLATIGRVATAEGYTVVLFKEQPVRFNNVTKPEQMNAVIQVRKVLWSAPNLDLTEQVILKMDAEYRSSK